MGPDMAKILVIDDEINIIKTLSSILQDEEHIVYSGRTGEEAMELLKTNDVDLAILDVWLPDVDGIDLLERIKNLNREIAVIMISGHGSIDIAVKSTRLGAYDFIQKPLAMERVITSVNNALEHMRLKRENIKLRKEFHVDDEMIGNSPRIQEIRDIIETAGKTNARVFITGDSGTGKELVARAIYYRSRRMDKPFVKVNCAAIPHELIESELFGHEKGAFTGAISRRMGKFELADNGTMFLDEICDMSLAAQAKVLRVLQENQFERVGGNETLTVDVRVIAATNVDVKKAVEEGTFREDLYYRLNVIPIHMPNLVERMEDFPMLVDYFLERFSQEHGIGLKQIDKAGMKELSRHSWPGNVRELKNMIERLSIMVPGEVIGRDDIRKHMESYDYDDFMTRDISSLKKAREDFEKDFIIRALKKSEGNVTAASKELGIERTNLHRKMKQYGINADRI